MRESAHFRNPRVALAFVIVGLFLAATGLVYLHYTGREQELTPPLPVTNQQIIKINAMLDALYVTLLLLGTFVVGSYIMTRIGRATLRKHDTTDVPRRTEYVDAWANYRVTDEQIQAATGGPPENEPPAEDPPSTT